MPASAAPVDDGSYGRYLQQLGQYQNQQSNRWAGTSMGGAFARPDATRSFGAYQPGQSYSPYGTNTSTGAARGSYDQGKANTAAGTPGYSDPTNGLTGQARVDASRGQVFANTEGRGQATMSDPYTQAALDRFKSVATGGTQPYDDTTKNAMLTSASNASAAAEGSQSQMLQQQMAMNGGSMSDPASQAAMRELAANRQGANQNALNGINMEANRANFAAANDGASNLASVRSNQNAQANQMYLAGAGFRAQDYATKESPGGTVRMSSSGMLGNQGYSPSPLPPLNSYQPSHMGQAPDDTPQPAANPTAAPAGGGGYNPFVSAPFGMNPFDPSMFYDAINPRAPQGTAQMSGDSDYWS
jgi:hypothetical protein